VADAAKRRDHLGLNFTTKLRASPSSNKGQELGAKSNRLALNLLRTEQIVRAQHVVTSSSEKSRILRHKDSRYGLLFLSDQA
jgi:hypothetical protein